MNFFNTPHSVQEILNLTMNCLMLFTISLMHTGHFSNNLIYSVFIIASIFPKMPQIIWGTK